MKEFKGTPGPWVASKSDRSIGPICKDDDQSYGMILPIAWVEFDGKPGHHQANANLIASAPQLLKELLKVQNAIKESDYWWIDYPDRGGFDLKAIDEAIDKALGEQP